jgi:hypothetical protein
VRIEGEARFEECVEQDAEGPGVCGAAVVGLAEDDFGGGVVVGAAAGGEFLFFGYAPREPEVGEGYDGVGVGGPVEGAGEFVLWEVDEDVLGLLVCFFMEWKRTYSRV